MKFDRQEEHDATIGTEYWQLLMVVQPKGVQAVVEKTKATHADREQNKCTQPQPLRTSSFQATHAFVCQSGSKDTLGRNYCHTKAKPERLESLGKTRHVPLHTKSDLMRHCDLTKPIKQCPKDCRNGAPSLS